MTASGRDHDPSRTVQVVRDAASGSAGALVGMAVGGPAGAVAGAGLAAVTTQVANVVSTHLRRRRDRLLQPSIDALGDAGVAELLELDPRLLALTLKAADMAARTEWESHVEALAAVLRDGLAGFHDTDETSRLLDAVGTITPDGIAILQLIVETKPPGHPHFVDSTIAEQFGWTRAKVRTSLRRLEDAGAVETIGSLMGGGEGWNPLPLGARVLDYLREAMAASESATRDG